jgi:predicted nucleotidyltransferase
MLMKQIIKTLRAHESELRRRGVEGLSLFGSVARGEAGSASDVDLAVRFTPAARVDLFEFAALSERMREVLGIQVDLISEPARAVRMQREIDRDRVNVF